MKPHHNEAILQQIFVARAPIFPGKLTSARASGFNLAGRLPIEERYSAIPFERLW